MTPRLTITSIHNRHVTEACKLAQRKYRQSEGRFLVEGLQILYMALDASLQPIDVFFCETLLKGIGGSGLLERFSHTDATLIAVSEPVMRRLSERSTPQGIAATFPLLDTSFRTHALTGHELVLVLDRLHDPGNVGTLLRTADAAGVAAVIMIEPCVDVFDPKVVRASMGSLFTVHLMCTEDVPRLFEWLADRGLRRVGADVSQGLWEMDTGGVALVLGSEAQGLSEDVRAYIEDWVRLPIIGRAESLNVAVAGGVLMYTWLRANYVSGGDP